MDMRPRFAPKIIQLESLSSVKPVCNQDKKDHAGITRKKQTRKARARNKDHGSRKLGSWHGTQYPPSQEKYQKRTQTAIQSSKARRIPVQDHPRRAPQPIVVIQATRQQAKI
jgi:hypothetical protein